MTETTPPYRYVDGDSFCLSARLLPDLNTGGVTDTLSITIEGSDEPQSVHVPAGDVSAVAAGIVAAAGQQPAATVPASAPTDQAACPRCAHDERTRDVLHLSTLELYPPDHTQECPAGLRDRIAALFRQPPRAERLGDQTPGEIADAVLAVLPAPAACPDPIECSHEAALGELAELRARLADYENRITWDTTCGSCARVLDSSIRETERAEKAEAAVEEQRLALSQALGLGTGAPWDAIRERAVELAAMPPITVDTSEDRCAECGHFRGAHEVAEEPVSVGRCTVCADDDEWHDFEPRVELPGPEVVAYSNSDRPGVLLCREHGDGWWGLTPLTSDDLPDGGICTYGDPADPNDRCGRDVLIPQPAAVSQPGKERTS